MGVDVYCNAEGHAQSLGQGLRHQAAECGPSAICGAAGPGGGGGVEAAMRHAMPAAMAM
eukprot:COSAG01_NODE_53251_length_340_cov_1.497925_2_plen_58_part_01